MTLLHIFSRLTLGCALGLSLPWLVQAGTPAGIRINDSSPASAEGLNAKCGTHPTTWEEALLREEKKQWPQAADTQPAINLTGVYLFKNPPEGQTCRQYIWQECLELTIAGGCVDNATQRIVSGSPLHHYVLNYSYGHADMVGKEKCSNPTNGNCYEEFGPTLNKALIVETTREWCETHGSEHAVMLVGPLLKGDDSGPGAVGWNAIRAIDRNGALVFAQNPNAAEQGAQKPTVMDRAQDQSLQCDHPGFDHESTYCKHRSYLDASWSFTPACCAANANLDPYLKFMDSNLYPPREVQPYPNGPNVVACDKSSPSRQY